MALCMNSWMVAAFHFSLLFTSIKADDLEIYSNTISRNARIMAFPSKILSLIKAKNAFHPRLIGIKMPNFTLCTPCLCKAGFFQCFLHVEKGSFFFFWRIQQPLVRPLFLFPLLPVPIIHSNPFDAGNVFHLR